jgi:primosomal protein N' (replication factor Y)
VTVDAPETRGVLARFAVPVPSMELLTYRLPQAMSRRAGPGMRALLPVGRGRKVGLLVERDVAPPPALDRIRDVERLIDERPVVHPELLAVLVQAAAYYHHPPGLAVESAMAPGRPGAGSERWVLTDRGGRLLESESAGQLERRILGLVAGGPKTPAQIARHAPLAGRDQLEELEARGLIARRASSAGRRTEKVLRLLRLPAPDDRPPGKVGRRVIDALGRADGVTLSALRSSLPVSDSTIRSLVKRGFVAVEQSGRWHLDDVPPSGEDSPYSRPPGDLNGPQKRAVETINNAVARGAFRAFLLHGVTGSGKTEVYIHAIRSVLATGRSAVVVVPEIALTPQLVAMFRSRVGTDIAILHSALPPARRRAQWELVRAGERKVVIGARSAVFAPVRAPGIFVVDEEHDTSFKQGEKFRYNARDLALLRAHREGSVAVLGSATPALESYHNALRGKYELLTLPDRATSQPLPEVEMVDLRHHRNGPGGQEFISGVLHRAMAETLEAGGQTILFINRRGFAPAAQCTACGEPVRCPDCSVPMVHHRFTDRLSCHYCGHSRDVPDVCPACESDDDTIELMGPGTERIERIVSDLFPTARVLRMDSDVAAGASSEPILAAMRRGEADVLVGTQMVTKGHDLPRVALVGVVRADMGMGMPDFRAAERTFQVLTQVAGRAGRGDRRGRVILQSYNPDHPCLAAARAQDYGAFFTWELSNRRAAGYPPFAHLALLRLSGKEEVETARAAADLAAALGAGPARVLGPVPSPLARLRGRFRHQVLLKAPTRPELRKSLALLPEPTWAPARGLRLAVDVDPLDFL